MRTITETTFRVVPGCLNLPAQVEPFNLDVVPFQLIVDKWLLRSLYALRWIPFAPDSRFRGTDRLNWRRIGNDIALVGVYVHVSLSTVIGNLEYKCFYQRTRKVGIKTIRLPSPTVGCQSEFVINNHQKKNWFLQCRYTHRGDREACLKGFGTWPDASTGYCIPAVSTALQGSERNGENKESLLFEHGKNNNIFGCYILDP